MSTPEILKARIENKPGVVGATMATRSGLYFDFIDPQPDQIRLTDIAWALSMNCRFNGHSLQFYSVAQHSVLVSQLVPAEHALAALLHDAAEAYVGDMVGPLKQLVPEYKAIEKRVEAAIFSKYSIPTPLDPSIKHADYRLLRTEQRDLTAASGDQWNGLDAYAPLPNTIRAYPPALAFEAFLDRFAQITGDSLHEHL